MEQLVLARVKWSVQPVNPYFRSGVGTIDVIATHSGSNNCSYKRIQVSISDNLPRPRKRLRTSFKRSVTRISGTTRHPRPTSDVAGWLPYEPNRNCTISRKEVQSQPSDKWHTTKKQPESNTIQHGDQSTTTTEPELQSTHDRLRWSSGNPLEPYRRGHIIQTNDHCTK